MHETYSEYLERAEAWLRDGLFDKVETLDHESYVYRYIRTYAFSGRMVSAAFEFTGAPVYEELFDYCTDGMGGGAYYHTGWVWPAGRGWGNGIVKDELKEVTV